MLTRNINTLRLAITWALGLVTVWAVWHGFNFAFIMLSAMAGMFNAGMDVVSFHYEQSTFKLKNKPQYYDPILSWTNKYNLPSNERKKWFGLIPIPVFLTDFWHREKALMLACLVLAVVTYEPIFNTSNHIINALIDFLIVRFAFGITFNMYYKWLYKLGKDGK